MKSRFLGASCVAALLAAWGSAAVAAEVAAQADDGSEEVVVTAQKRSERVQDVPIAISTLSAGEIEDRHITNLLDLNNIAPNMRITTADAAANPKIFIRGVGLNDFNPTSSAGVGVYIDGVYQASPLAQISAFFDLERVEVLRGPQGTLYGRNTTGGAINAISRRPSWETRADASLEYGNYNAITLSAGYGGTIIEDKLAFRVAGQYVADDGYTVNRVTGHDINNADRYAFRGSLLFTPTENDEFLLNAMRFVNRGGATQTKHRALFPATPDAVGPGGLCAPGYYNNGGCTDAVGYYDPVEDPFSVESDVEGKDKVDLFTASLNYTHDFGDISLVSITAWQQVDRNALENTDASPLQMLQATYIGSQDTYTQELRLQNDEGPAKWVVGVYYMNDEIRNSSSYDILRMLRPLFTTPENPTGVSPENSVIVLGYPYTQKTEGYAIFSQLDYELNDKLTLTGGLRWSQDDKSLDYTRLAEGSIVLFTAYREKSFSDFSGRLGVKYDISDTWNVYASYNRGYKSGGFFGGSADDPAQLDPYDNETVNAYEVGSKGSFLDRAVRLNLSAFYYDYENIQAYSMVERGGLTVQILDNAASAEVYGAEVELAASPIEHLDLSLALSFLHAKYGAYNSLGGDYSGNQMPQAPEFTMQFGAAYEFVLQSGGSITPRVDVNYRSKIYFDSTQTERLSSPALWQLDAQIGWTSQDGQIEAGIWGKNLTDEHYLQAISNIDSLGVDLLTYGRPATYGVFLRYSF